jgi:hypothetical protein
VDCGVKSETGKGSSVSNGCIVVQFPFIGGSWIFVMATGASGRIAAAMTCSCAVAPVKEVRVAIIKEKFRPHVLVFLIAAQTVTRNHEGSVKYP